MIIKFFDIKKIELSKNKFLLLYGKNEGLKNSTVDNVIKDHNNVYNYEEKEILNNKEIFLENIFSKSLFEPEKVIIIKRTTDKILKIIDQLLEKKIEDTYIILKADNLDKKSKLRSFFEKSKQFVIIAFYPDKFDTLFKLANNFFRENKISISNENINLIISKCNNDRETLLNEMGKIAFFAKNGKKITYEKITKLTNLLENHDISTLIDHCLAKNKQKVVSILNENNFNNEDCILIIRTFLNKSKKILILINEYKNNKDIDLTISKAKPPIFWMNKEITKEQIKIWTPENIKKLIYKVNEIEHLIKKNLNNSVNFVTNFILEVSASKINS